MTDRSKERPIKIEQMGVDEIIPYEKNPRKHKKSLPELIKSIRMFGFTQPIVIDQNNRIVAGHGRRLAAKELMITKVPCVRVELSNDEYIKLVLADNKITEMSKWDNKLLQECLTILGDLENVEVPAFDDKEIDKIFGYSFEDTQATDDAAEEADFGGGVKVSTEGDDRALVKKKTFILTTKEHEYITSKLKAIKKEHGLDTEAEALITALKPYKGLPKVTKKSGPVREVSSGEE